MLFQSQLEVHCEQAPTNNLNATTEAPTPAYCNLDDEIICQVTNITPQTGKFPSQLAKCFSRMGLQFNILDIQVWLDCGLTEAGFSIYLPDDLYRFKGYIATNSAGTNGCVYCKGLLPV